MNSTLQKLALAGAVLAPLAFAAPALAAAPSWDTSGDYVVVFNLGGDYAHDLTLAQDGAGQLTGGGGYPAGGAHTYAWHLVSGSVSGNTIDFVAEYTAPGDATTPLTTMHVIGTIAAGGTMSGTWTDNYQAGTRAGTWVTSSGAAEPVVVLVGPPTTKDECKDGGWMTFNNPSFVSQSACVSSVEKTKHDKDDGKVKGNLTLLDPSQSIKFDISHKDEKGKGDKKNTVEYTNNEYPGGLSYTAEVLCSSVDEKAKDARFMFQIPAGHPGLTGLYVVAYVKDMQPKKVADLFGFSATADSTTATTWCETGEGFAPSFYAVAHGKVEVKK